MGNCNDENRTYENTELTQERKIIAFNIGGEEVIGTILVSRKANYEGIDWDQKLQEYRAYIESEENK